jgi:competence protein ComEA
MKLEELRERFLDFTIEQRRALVSISVIAIGVALYFTLSSRSEVLASPDPVQVKKLNSSETTTALLFIHVAGKVAKPGVYPVLKGSRVVDAIAAAGGALKGTDLSDINLARQVVDGEQIYVSNATASSRAGNGASYNGKININRAGLSGFDSLPGIGPVIAGRIVAYRKANGPFQSVDDLQKVNGVGAKTFERIKGRLSL